MLKISVGQAIEAFAAIDEIRGQKTNKEVAKQLYFLRKKLSETVEFYNEIVESLSEILEF